MNILHGDCFECTFTVHSLGEIFRSGQAGIEKEKKIMISEEKNQLNSSHLKAEKKHPLQVLFVTVLSMRCLFTTSLSYNIQFLFQL